MRCGAIFHNAGPCYASNRQLRIATIRGCGLTIARKIASRSSIPDSYWWTLTRRMCAMHGGSGQIACPSVLNLLRARTSGILISASWARRVKTLRWRIRKASGRGSSCVAIAVRCSCRRADQIAKRRSRIMRSIAKSAGRKMLQASLSACTCIANLARKHCVFWCPTHSLASTMRWFSRLLRLCNWV